MKLKWMIFLLTVFFTGSWIAVYAQEKPAVQNKPTVQEKTAAQVKPAAQTAPAAAAEPAVKQEEVKVEKKEDKGINPPLGLSGKMYLEFKTETLVDGKEKTTFALTRAYLTYERVLWGPLSFNITSDVGTGMKSDGKAGATSITVAGQAYEFYIKNAYLQGAHDWGFLAIKSQFGIINTPSIAITSKMQDLRWVYSDYSFDRTHDIGVKPDNPSGNEGIESSDTSADVGFNFTTRIFKYVELTYTICNGEGYKHPVETYDGKSHYGTISIMPHKWIYINGYINYERTSEFRTDYYYGGGIAFYSDMLKVGANYVLHGVKNSDVDPYVYHTVEAWLHFNLGEIVKQAPVLFVGRFAWGIKNAEPDLNRYTIAGGLGWQFNKYIRILAYYESYKSTDEPGYAAFYLKSEARF